VDALCHVAFSSHIVFEKPDNVCFQVRAKVPAIQSEQSQTPHTTTVSTWKQKEQPVLWTERHGLHIMRSFYATIKVPRACYSFSFFSVHPLTSPIYQNRAPFIHNVSKQRYDNTVTRVRVFIHVLRSARQLGASGLIIIIIQRLGVRRRYISSWVCFVKRIAEGRENFITNIAGVESCI
jgi:hypothetical protein